MISKSLFVCSLLSTVGAAPNHDALSKTSIVDKHSLMKKGHFKPDSLSEGVAKKELPADRKKLKKSEAWGHNLMFKRSTDSLTLKDKIEKRIGSHDLKEAMQKHNSKHSKKSDEHHVHDLVNEPLDFPVTNMRGARNLKLRDNFFVWTFFSDMHCNEMTMGEGEAVNQCYNRPYDEGSYTLKVNKKENVAVMLEYDTPHCIGVPSAIYDFERNVLPFKEFGHCYNEMHEFWGMSWKVEYTDTFPHKALPGPVYVGTVNPRLCAYNYYSEFESYPPNKCVPTDDMGSIYIDASGCGDGSHEVKYMEYMTNDCTGSPRDEGSAKAGECWVEHDWYGELPDCTQCDEMSSTDPSVCYQSTSSEYGSCHSCGLYYSGAPSEVYDCVSCDEGYEIDVIFDDCTGLCVPEGTAYRPISKDTCNYPCAKCGYPLHDQAMFTTCVGECHDVSYTDCFKGDSKYAGCSRCGYYGSGADAMNPDDCISCPHGYEIDVVYGDCTGYCVKAGTAKKSLIDSNCEMPCASCGSDYDGWYGASELSGRVTVKDGYMAKFAMCPTMMP